MERVRNTIIKTWLLYVGITSLLFLNIWILSFSFKRAQEHETRVNDITHSSLLLEQIKTNHLKKEQLEKEYKRTKSQKINTQINNQKTKIKEQLEVLLKININASEKENYSSFQKMINSKIKESNISQKEINEIIELIKQKQQENIELSTTKATTRQNIFYWFLVTISGLFWLLLTFTISQLNINNKRSKTEEIERKQLSWLKNHLNEIDRLTSEDMSPQKLAQIILNYINQFPFVIDAKFYIFQEETIEQIGQDNKLNHFITPQAGNLIIEARKKKVIWQLNDIPENYWSISSGLGKGNPNSILFIPITLKNKELALIEVASFEIYSKRNLDLFYGLKEIIGANFNIIQSRQEQKILLKKTQILAKELKSQKDDLKAANNVLATQARELETHQESLNTRNTLLKETQKELELKAVALEKSNTYKSDFLTKVSHELRTPLNGVLLLSTLLIENKEKTLTSKQVQFAQSINSAGNDLLLLITDILDLSKIEAHKLTIHEDEFSIIDFITNIYKTFSQQVEIKGLKLSVEIDDSLRNKIIKTDRMRLEQIFRNFMSNAIKFTTKGAITIFVKQNNESDTLSFGVKDTGIGIKDDKKEIIFKAFEQADGTISRQYGGTGLGLTISLELANLIGAKIKSESQVGVGSKFEIILSTNIFTSNTQVITKKSNVIDKILTNEEFLNDKNILIVDDDIRNLFALTSVLERKGLVINAAKNGIDALKILRSTPNIELVLMDIMMPIMDGYETIKNIRKTNNRYKNVPIIALTAHATSEDKEKCLQVGANDFLAKPVNTENLLKLLKKQLSTNEMLNAIN